MEAGSLSTIKCQRKADKSMSLLSPGESRRSIFTIIYNEYEIQIEISIRTFKKKFYFQSEADMQKSIRGEIWS
jgi:hypothetical protein